MTVTVRVRTIVWFATAVALGVIATLAVTQAWRADAAPGDVDSTFVPTAGCRLLDTRPTGPLNADDVLEVTVRGANGDCTGTLAIPTDAVGVALNVTAVNATTSSNIRLYPANLAEVPLLSNLNVVAGGPPTPNKVDVQLSPDGKIKVYNFRGSVDVVLDVVGYYTKSSLAELAAEVAALKSAVAQQGTTMFAAVNADGTLRASSGVVDVDVTGSGVYEITFERPVDDECAVAFGDFTAGGESASLLQYGTPRGPSIVSVFTFFANGAVRSADFFDITVVCPPRTP